MDRVYRQVRRVIALLEVRVTSQDHLTDLEILPDMSEELERADAAHRRNTDDEIERFSKLLRLRGRTTKSDCQ